MTEPTYNANAIKELYKTIKSKDDFKAVHSQREWMKNKTNDIDRANGKNALESIRESMKK